MISRRSGATAASRTSRTGARGERSIAGQLLTSVWRPTGNANPRWESRNQPRAALSSGIGSFRRRVSGKIGFVSSTPMYLIAAAWLAGPVRSPKRSPAARCATASRCRRCPSRSPGGTHKTSSVAAAVHSGRPRRHAPPVCPTPAGRVPGTRSASAASRC